MNQRQQQLAADWQKVRPLIVELEGVLKAIQEKRTAHGLKVAKKLVTVVSPIITKEFLR